MCTIVVLHRVHPTYPVVVAANRDEFLGRATGAPRVLHSDPIVVGGIDLEKGGTWMGATASGAFVGLTNQRSYAGSDTSLLSRGAVVLDSLRAGTRERIRAYLRGIDPARYNSFNLVYGDAGGVELAKSRQDTATMSIEALAPGVIVVSNDALDASEFPKLDRARELVSPIAAQPWESMAPNLLRCLADHDAPHPERLPEPPAGSVFGRAQLVQLQQLCVHMGIYGTRSSTVMALTDGAVASYLYAAGPPCETPLEDVTALFRTPAPPRP